MKIQQMAFVLVAFFILFSIALVFYFSFKTATLRSDALLIRQDKARETVQKLAGSPEFSWTMEDCAACVDLDKVFSLKDRPNYASFWGSVPYIQIKQVYPRESGEVECTQTNYPNCDAVTLVDKAGNYTTEDAYVALCRFDKGSKQTLCKLGVIRMGVKS
jgi:hypothetical protein